MTRQRSCNDGAQPNTPSADDLQSVTPYVHPQSVLLVSCWYISYLHEPTYLALYGSHGLVP